MITLDVDKQGLISVIEPGTLVHGDCLEAMQYIPDASIDMILCDLPYGVTAAQKWDVIIPFLPLWECYARIIKPGGVIVLFGTGLFSAKLMLSAPKCLPYRYSLIWRKNKVTGFLNANKMPMRRHEDILVFYGAKPTYNPQKTIGHKPVNSNTKHPSDAATYGRLTETVRGGGSTERYPCSVLDFDVVNNDSPDRIHPSQKPVALMEYLVKTFSNASEIVLNNCMGSASTCIACINTGRQFIGIEKDAKNYALAIKRVSDYLHTKPAAEMSA